MLPLKGPFYLFEDEDCIIFEKLGDMELFLEPIDAADQDAVLYCRDGRQLKPVLEGRRVRVVESEKRADPAQLRRLLIDFLVAVGADVDEETELDDAVRVSRRYSYRPARTLLEVFLSRKNRRR